MIQRDKAYVDKVEAYEICLSHGINKLPRKGQEWLTVRAMPKITEILGKDEHGYYMTMLIDD